PSPISVLFLYTTLFRSRYIIVFDFEETVFDDALTTASILLFANDNEKSEVEFINVKSLDELQSLQTKIQSYPKSEADKSFSFSEDRKSTRLNSSHVKIS